MAPEWKMDMQNSYAFQGVRIGRPTFKNRSGERQATACFSIQVPKSLRKPGQPSRIPTRCDTKEKAEAFTQRWLKSRTFQSAVEADQTPLLEHLGTEDPATGEWDGFGAAIKKPEWRKSKLGRLRKLFAGCGFTRLSDLDAGKTREWLDRQVNSGKMSVQTRNHYIVTLKHFVHWALDTGKLEKGQDPIGRALRTRKPDDTERRVRRYMSDDEIRRLRKAAESRRHPNGPSGTDKSICYLLAVNSGFRRAELASLTRASFDLDAGIVKLAAKFAKNHTAVRQPLSPSVVAELRPWLETKEWGVRLFKLSRRTAEMFRTDCARAGIEIGNDEGEGILDCFHCLRHTYCARLALANVPLKHAQQLMRHKTIELTASVYGRLKLGDLHAAVNTLPAL
jgi:integrase